MPESLKTKIGTKITTKTLVIAGLALVGAGLLAATVGSKPTPRSYPTLTCSSGSRAGQSCKITVDCQVLSSDREARCVPVSTPSSVLSTSSGALPDLTVSTGAHCTTDGGIEVINRFTNTGTADAGPFSYRATNVSADGSTLPTPSVLWSYPLILMPGNFTTESYTIPPDWSARVSVIHSEVDIDSIVAESNEANNSADIAVQCGPTSASPLSASLPYLLCNSGSRMHHACIRHSDCQLVAGDRDARCIDRASLPDLRVDNATLSALTDGGAVLHVTFSNQSKVRVPSFELRVTVTRLDGSTMDPEIRQTILPMSAYETRAQDISISSASIADGAKEFFIKLDGQDEIVEAKKGNNFFRIDTNDIANKDAYMDWIEDQWGTVDNTPAWFNPLSTRLVATDYGVPRATPGPRGMLPDSALSTDREVRRVASPINAEIQWNEPEGESFELGYDIIFREGSPLSPGRSVAWYIPETTEIIDGSARRGILHKSFSIPPFPSEVGAIMFNILIRDRNGIHYIEGGPIGPGIGGDGFDQHATFWYEIQ